MAAPETSPFSVTTDDGAVIRGEQAGIGRDLVLCHGLSATRRAVVHGSLYLPRRGYRVTVYDARGHGESTAGPGGFGYGRLTADLGAVMDETGVRGPLGLGGHSMGCHTVAAQALAGDDRIGALILIGPAVDGGEDPAGDRWERRAAAIEQSPERFAEVASELLPEGEARERNRRLALDRARLHHSPALVAEALRRVPRSLPFEGLDSLAAIRVPSLVVGSRDELDPGHPLAVARRWAEAIPEAELVVEAEGAAPLAWQGGRLSRLIDEFLTRHGLGGRHE